MQVKRSEAAQAQQIYVQKKNWRKMKLQNLVSTADKLAPVGNTPVGNTPAPMG